MAGIDDRPEELGIVLPERPVPAASRVPFVRSGSTLHVPGQAGRGAGGPIVASIAGRLGDDLDVAAARTCRLPLPARVRAAVEVEGVFEVA